MIEIPRWLAALLLGLAIPGALMMSSLFAIAVVLVVDWFKARKNRRRA